jgi:hypothetical protein
MIPNGGGKIINIASMLSFQAVPGVLHTPARAARRLTRLLATSGQPGHQRQRHRAGLLRHQQHRRAAG